MGRVKLGRQPWPAPISGWFTSAFVRFGFWQPHPPYLIYDQYTYLLIKVSHVAWLAQLVLDI